MSLPNDGTRLGESAPEGARLKELEDEIARLKKELAESERSRVEYLQNVAHQLVAPLNAMKWHIENINANRVSIDRARKVLRSIYSQATIAVHLAKNFALMSNLEADHALSSLREPLEPVALSALLVNLADDFQPQGWDREVHIEVVSNMLDTIPDVLVIKPLMSQVFSNIIENAIKYSNDGTQVTISGEYHKFHDLALIRIENRGIPVAAADALRIFERGYRTNEARNKYPAGTGFGLYIAKRVAEMHEGEIEVVTDGSGRTTFEVSIPVKGLEGKALQWPKKKRSF